MADKYDDLQYKISRKIALERIKRGLSQEKLAEKANLSKTYVCGIEKATSSPTIITLAKIADAFDMKLKDLVDVTKVDL